MSSSDEDADFGPRAWSRQGQGGSRDEIQELTINPTAITSTRETDETISQDRTENKVHVFAATQTDQPGNPERPLKADSGLLRKHTKGKSRAPQSKSEHNWLADEAPSEDSDSDSGSRSRSERGSRSGSERGSESEGEDEGEGEGESESQSESGDGSGNERDSRIPDVAVRSEGSSNAGVDGLLADKIPPGLPADRVISKLLLSLSCLQVENEQLKEQLAALRSSASRSFSGQVREIEEEIIEGNTKVEDEIEEEADDLVGVSPGIPTFHEVFRSSDGPEFGGGYSYRDPPRLFKGDRETDHLRGTRQVDSVGVYLEHHPEVGFAAAWEYSSSRATVLQIFLKSGYRNGALTGDSAYAEPGSKHIALGPALKSAIGTILKAFPERFPEFTPDLPSNIQEPYLLFYLHNTALMELKECSGLADTPKRQLGILCQWMEDNCRLDWDEADELLSTGKINKKHIEKLYRPKELVVSTSHVNGSLQQGYRVGNYHQLTPGTIPLIGWGFNGLFHESTHKVDLRAQLASLAREGFSIFSGEDRAFEVTKMRFCPVRFLEDDVQSRLVARGLKFWECRKKRLVCYHEPDGEFELQAERRYMVDYKMYKRLHPKKRMFDAWPHSRNQELMEREDPPEDDFLACLPPTIAAFDFSRKAWKLLNVDRISDVTWNKTAFSQLVAPDETKELIQAVVTAHGQKTSIAPDIIEGKGQGLLILLHGGPGTGKTLTAESIAEEQERPLYRVTCGDIGIEPYDVERYLGDVLEIGKAWGCVVLLDEADVFLEERTLADQKRNATISIFLRILEYYDGILILTTNRVGTFDEAFKSRIQLALGYPRLDERDRLKIWSNFIKMLGRTKERIDMADLELSLPRLARVEINGRQIRNIITMAWHLAKFRGQMLRYRHMQDAVKSVQKFNEYLDQVKGVPDDDWARADKLR